MSVIGRLDERVDEVLIAPVEKNQRKVKKAESEISTSDEAAEMKGQSANERNAERKELPVWLL
jgi:hypothetical protein